MGDVAISYFLYNYDESFYALPAMYNIVLQLHHAINRPKRHGLFHHIITKPAKPYGAGNHAMQYKKTGYSLF